MNVIWTATESSIHLMKSISTRYGYLENIDYENSPVLSGDSLKEMQKPFPNVKIPSPPSADVTDIGYGLGWGIETYKGVDMIAHGGGYPGVKSWVGMIQSKNFGVVVLTNYDEANPQEIACKGIDVLFGGATDK